MVIDHMGLIYFEDVEIFRIIGRVAFPVYLYMCVEGYKNTHSKGRYAVRMLLFSLMSAYPCYIAFGNLINIGVTYLCVIGLCFAIDLIKKEKSMAGIIVISAIFLLAVSLQEAFCYSWYGLAMGMILYLRDDKKLFMSQISMIIVTYLYILYRPQMVSFIVSLPVFLILPYINNKWIYGKYRIKYFFYLFYPGHILLLYLIKLLVSG